VTGVYYINESHQKDRLMTALGYGLTRTNSIDLTDLYRQPAPSTTSAASHLPSYIQNVWTALNPYHLRSVDICLLPTRAYILPSLDIKVKPSQLIGSLKAMNRPLLPRIKPIFYLLKIVVLPQLLTAFLLWLVLRFLLKDAELLDAQRERADIDDVEQEEALSPNTSQLPSTKLGAMVKQTEATCIPTIGYTDILDIWTNEAASVVVIADSDHKMRILEQDQTMSVAFATYPGHRDLVYLDSQGKLLAMAFGNGNVHLYDTRSLKGTSKATFTWDYTTITKSPPCGILIVNNIDFFANSWSILTLHVDGSILSYSAGQSGPTLIASPNTHDAPRRLLARQRRDWPRFAVSTSPNYVEEWECIGDNGWAVTGRITMPDSVITDCELISIGGDDFWLLATNDGTVQLSTFPENQVLYESTVTDEPIIKVRALSPSADPCGRCALPKTSLPVDLVYWTKSTVGHCRLSFELPYIEVCMCARHPGGRASLSRPLDGTPARAFASVSKKVIQPGSASKQRSTSPSPNSRHGRLSVESGLLLGGRASGSRTDSEEETLITASDPGARRDWVVHLVGTGMWNVHRGVAILLPALNLLLAIGKVKREWQATLIDLEAINMPDSELSLPVEAILRSDGEIESARHDRFTGKFRRLAFASIKNAAAGTHTILFGQGNALIRLQLPKPVEDATSLSRRVSGVFSVPPSANSTASSFGGRQIRSPIPLKLNGNSISPH
jgi:hypothetical protein